MEEYMRLPVIYDCSLYYLLRMATIQTFVYCCSNVRGCVMFTCTNVQREYKIFSILRCCDVVVCPAGSWGQNCENRCRCDESCDRVVGCTSCDDYPGWTGPNCDEYVDKCQNATQYCGANSVCINANGSSICGCEPWYQRLSGREDKCDCKY